MCNILSNCKVYLETAAFVAVLDIPIVLGLDPLQFCLSLECCLSSYDFLMSAVKLYGLAWQHLWESDLSNVGE
jgi:hypothetical protein